MVEIITASEKDALKIQELLRENELPDCGIIERIQDFFIAFHAGAIVGVIGLVVSEKRGLLRSLAVHADFRNRGIAAQLLKTAIQKATSLELDSLYLLTGTATAYFLRNGFNLLNYAQFPIELLQVAGMETVCTACHDSLRLQLPNTRIK